MKRWCWLVFISLFWAQGSLAKTIVAATNSFPPFVDPNNPTGGLSIEIVRAAYKTQGHDVNVVYVPWARAEAGLVRGTYDISPGIWFSEWRSKELAFSNAYVNNTIRFVKRKGDPFVFQGIESLKGKTIGIVRSYAYNDSFKTSNLFRREEANNLLVNLKKLQAGRVDLTLDDEAVISDTIAKNNPKMFAEIELAEGKLSVNPLHVASGYKNPNHKEWIESFNAGLKVIKENGTLTEILKKYGLTHQ